MTAHVLVVWRVARGSLGRDFAGRCSRGWEGDSWDAGLTEQDHFIECGVPTSIRRGVAAAECLPHRSYEDWLDHKSSLDRDAFREWVRQDVSVESPTYG